MIEKLISVLMDALRKQKKKKRSASCEILGEITFIESQVWVTLTVIVNLLKYC